jgi:hypothetical protein
MPFDGWWRQNWNKLLVIISYSRFKFENNFVDLLGHKKQSDLIMFLVLKHVLSIEKYFLPEMI